MPEVHMKENWRKSPSWFQTSWRTVPTSERGGRDWDGRATSSLAADAASSTSERVERIESGGGKKSKMQQKYVNVTSDDLWCIQDKLASKKSSPGKTYKTNREAYDKGLRMNQQASKYAETLASLYANFERICTETEVEEQFDWDFDESPKMLSERCSRCIRVAETYARIEDDFNEGLRVILNYFQETATATLALTCGKNDQVHNEVLYLQETLAMVDSLLARDAHDDCCEVVVTERPVAQWMRNEEWISELVWQLCQSGWAVTEWAGWRWIGCIIVVVFGSVVMGPHLGQRE